MVFCSSCGNEETTDKNFCSKCGSKLITNSFVDEVSRRSSIVPPRRSKWFYLIPVFLGLIGAICTYFFLRKEDPELAKNCLILGIILTVIYFIIGMFSGMPEY